VLLKEEASSRWNQDLSTNVNAMVGRNTTEVIWMLLMLSYEATTEEVIYKA